MDHERLSHTSFLLLDRSNGLSLKCLWQIPPNFFADQVLFLFQQALCHILDPFLYDVFRIDFLPKWSYKAPLRMLRMEDPHRRRPFSYTRTDRRIPARTRSGLFFYFAIFSVQSFPTSETLSRSTPAFPNGIEEGLLRDSLQDACLPFPLPPRPSPHLAADFKRRRTLLLPL